MSNKEDINKYCFHFKERLEEIKTIENRLYQKILIVTMIDSLAHAVYPGDKVRERFIKFVKNFSGWKDHCRVSLPQLALNLQSDSTDSELRIRVKERLDSWKNGRIYRINEVDPCKQELEKLATTQEYRKLIENSFHAELLYTYRNHLVHEFREPGHPPEISSDNTSPYYCGVTEIYDEIRDGTYSDGELREIMRSSRRTWELVYPLGFFVSISEKSLASLRRRLEEDDLNPYSSYQFGSIWRPNR
jgi:hypothetical protein